MHERVWNDYAKIIEINENDEMMRQQKIIECNRSKNNEICDLVHKEMTEQ